MSPVADSPLKVESSQPSPKKLKADGLAGAAVTLQIAVLSENATIPTRGSARAAGYDLYSAEDTEIAGRGKGLVKTDIQIKVPSGTYGRIAPRSGLSWKNHIDIGAGVVDEDYRGNVGELHLVSQLSSLGLVFRSCHVQPRRDGLHCEERGPDCPAGL